MNVNLKETIKTAIAKNDAVIFLGTGISTYTTDRSQDVANWKGLLRNGLEKCQKLDRITSKTSDYFLKRFETTEATIDDYLKAADLIFDTLKMEAEETKTNVFETWLNETIGSLVPKKMDLIKAIGELDCPILTTNYDSLLEKILEKKPLTWKKYRDEGIGDVFANLKNYILHVHGYYEEPDSVVFNKQDYSNILNNEFAQAKLKALMETKTLLFLGYGAGLSDPNFSNLLEWKHRVSGNNSLHIYKVIRSNKKQSITDEAALFENIKTIEYGSTDEDLVAFIKSLKSTEAATNEEISLSDKKKNILKKYLNYLIDEYAYVSVFGYSKAELKLPLEKVYVDLKFDPAHPSVKAMKILEIAEEFKRKLFAKDFFDENEKIKIYRAYFNLCKKTPQNINNLYKNFMLEQWLNVLLDNKEIFSKDEATSIKEKVMNLKKQITENINYPEAENCEIQEIYDDFRHFIILGHPGSGKTTLSKWMVVNMAKQMLEEKNSLFSDDSNFKPKLPILIPIWKYVTKLNESDKSHKISLLQFIYENPTLDSKYFENEDDKYLLSQIIKEYLVRGDSLIILEGLDEIPIYMDRSDLMKEINALIERQIDYDSSFNKLSYSVYEHKEVCGTQDPDIGNRFIITSRIEGNYFQEINLYVPRLTIEDMSNDALKSFCSSYMEAIKDITIKSGRMTKDYDVDQLYKDIKKNEDIFKLAINPQLASLIASVYNQYEGELPNKRIDLYEKAIERMIERLINLFSSNDLAKAATKQFTLNRTIVWSIMQEIADYLHNRTEGLTEDTLRAVIKKCLLESYKQSQFIEVAFEDIIMELVDIFKVHSGLLSEFGHNSFKFLHRTFQEYLAGRNIVYLNGIERDEELIYDNIRNKMAIPNWRVPLSMALGILSKSINNNKLFDNITSKLMNEGINTKTSTIIVPFFVIESLSDITFVTKDKEHDLIQKISELMLADYKNSLGFSRLREHQELIEAYFTKIKDSNEKILTTWFIEKLELDENIAPCASILFQLKWYSSKFHESFIKNMHNDSCLWKWPVDAILKFYFNISGADAIMEHLKLKANIISRDYPLLNNNFLLLRLIVALYGGFKDYNTCSEIVEYCEIASFLQLAEHERIPFILYYQEVWGKEDPVMKMAYHLDNFGGKDNWNEKPFFDKKQIYKESYLTEELLSVLNGFKPIVSLKNDLIEDLREDNLKADEKIDSLLALIALGEYEVVKNMISEMNETSKNHFKTRIQQLMSSLKDPLTRCSSEVAKYLIEFNMSMNETRYGLKFSNYLKIFLYINAVNGGFAINTHEILERLNDTTAKEYLYAEYFAYNFTGAYNFDRKEDITAALDSFKGNSDDLIKAFLAIRNAIQLYRPTRTYLWPMDIFIFKVTEPNDIPISFLNIIEYMNRNISFIKLWINQLFYNDDLYQRNPDLIPIMVLSNFGNMTQYSDDLLEFTFDVLTDGLNEEENIKEALLKKIDLITNIYYKSRALTQLALYYETKSFELFTKAFQSAQEIQKPNLKFQVLEMIFSNMQYKDYEEYELQTGKKLLLANVLKELDKLIGNIGDSYDEIIACVRLSFYYNTNDRYKYLKRVIDTLSKMDDGDDKVELLINLKPLFSVFSDLEVQLRTIIDSINDQETKSFINSNYGSILTNLSNLSEHKTQNNLSNHITLTTLYTLYGQLHDITLLFEEKRDINYNWKNLLKNPADQANIDEIVEYGIKNELTLTQQAAVVIDELVKSGKESNISIIFPYLVKPSNEVLPVVYRWFNDRKNTQIRNLAAIILTENKFVFYSGLDVIKNFLKSDNDQLRYRAQRILQHPERGPQKAEKRISVIGESTIFKIFEMILTNEHVTRVRVYLRTFFYDLLWDDPEVYLNLAKKVSKLKSVTSTSTRCYFLSYIQHIDKKTWKKIIESIEVISYPTFHEELVLSSVALVFKEQVDDEDWASFTKALLSKDVSSFKSILYFTVKDIGLIEFIVEHARYFFESDHQNENSLGEYIRARIISEKTVPFSELLVKGKSFVSDFYECNFRTSVNDLNKSILDFLNTIPTEMRLFENLMVWLIKELENFNGFQDSHFDLMLSEILLSLVAALAQKEDYFYRKITNSESFIKKEFTKLLEKILNNHPYFAARGSAFVLLAAMDKPDHSIIINSLNSLLDENLVKNYSVLAIPMIHLADEFIEDLLKLLKTESAVKAYEVLKILTEHAQNDKIDAYKKSKILNYLTKEIQEVKTKKAICFYYTDIKIPFTTTLENELYKSWVKIQGLSGKNEYNSRLTKTKNNETKSVVSSRSNSLNSFDFFKSDSDSDV